MRSGVVVGMRDVIVGKHVAEKLLFQRFAGKFRLERLQRKRDLLAGQRLLEGVDRVGHAEAEAVLAVGDLKGVLVADGVYRRFTLVFLIQLVEVDRLGELLLIDIF